MIKEKPPFLPVAHGKAANSLVCYQQPTDLLFIYKNVLNTSGHIYKTENKHK